MMFIWIINFFALFSLSFGVPKDYGKKPGLSKFQFAKDMSSRNYRKQDKCGIDIVLTWKKEVQSSCFSTPVAFPLFNNGQDDIIVNSFWKYVDVINKDGISSEGWPVSMEDNRFYGSPIVFDDNNDGIEDIIMIDDTGVIYAMHLSERHSFSNITAYYLPTLAIDRYWFKNQNEVLDSKEVKQFAHTTLISHLNNKTLYSESGIRDLHNSRINEQYNNYVSNSFSHIHLDPHVLADSGKFIDSTNLILYIPISYYLTTDDYPQGLHDIPFEKYEACGVTAINLSTNSIMWSVVLGLSTHSSPNQATIFSTPVAVDLEGMGQLTTIFGTSQGYLYALNEKGEIRQGFPVHFGVIEMSVVCVDLADDSYLEIIVGDLSGNLAVLDYHGEEVWSQILSGGLSHSVVVGDVNGDGQLDIVALTKNGDLWVLNGQTGESLRFFPIRFGCSIHSSPLLLQFDESERGLRVVLITKEGELFIVNGMNGCVTRIDINEEIYSQIIAVEGDEQGLLSLILATMDSSILKLTTSGHWNQLNRFANTDVNIQHTYLPHYLGIYYGDGKQQWLEVMGNHVILPITIIDKRKNRFDSFYKISVIRKGSILYENVFHDEGEHNLLFDINETGYYNIVVILENEHKQIINMNVSIHANIEALNYLKWIVVIPVILISTLLFCSSNLGSPLPL